MRRLSRAGMAALAIVALLRSAPREARAECLPLLPRPAASYIVPGAQEFVYATPPGGAPLLLDAFAQPDGKVHPAVLVVHGGGWTSGSRRRAHRAVPRDCSPRRAISGSPSTTGLAGAARWQDGVDDVRAALAFVGCHAKALRDRPRSPRRARRGRRRATGRAGGDRRRRQRRRAGRRRLRAADGAARRADTGRSTAAPTAKSPVAQARAFCDRIVAARQLPCRARRRRRRDPSRRELAAVAVALQAAPGRVAATGGSAPAPRGRSPSTPQPVRATSSGPGLHKRLIYNAETGHDVRRVDAAGRRARTCPCCWSMAADGKPAIASPTSRRCSVRWPTPASRGSRWTIGSRPTSRTPSNCRTCAMPSRFSASAPAASTSTRAGW